MTFNPGDVVTVDFPGVTAIKRRPALVLSSAIYHATRPDVIVGLITSQTTDLGANDYVLEDWVTANLQVASVFRSFVVTLPPSANLVLIGKLSERDWKGVRACVKAALAELDELTPLQDTPPTSLQWIQTTNSIDLSLTGS